MRATGTFDVKITPQASDLAPEGPNLGRMSLDKQYHGDLEAAAKGEMITAAGIAVKESAAYSAVERVTGALHDNRSNFYDEEIQAVKVTCWTKFTDTEFEFDGCLSPDRQVDSRPGQPACPQQKTDPANRQ